MSFAVAERIASAVLYEGYVLYPYRPTSIKNQVRWTFGGVYPEAYGRAHGEPFELRVECLVRGSAATTVETRLRFLQLVARTIERREGDAYVAVPALTVGELVLRPWQEAVEQTCAVSARSLGELAHRPHAVRCAFPAAADHEPLLDGAARIVRHRCDVAGMLTTRAELVRDGLYRLRFVLVNDAPCDATDRERALEHAFVAAHAMFNVEGGRFVSMVDTEDDLREPIARCENVGAWPVLVGDPGADAVMLASPIILPDYPEVAPESTGDLFDATEIDEILSLRILTLTDAEKQEMRAADPRVRALLERTEALGAEGLMKLHGTLRTPRWNDG